MRIFIDFYHVTYGQKAYRILSELSSRLGNCSLLIPAAGSI